jgi:hypothetical protein
MVSRWSDYRTTRPWPSGVSTRAGFDVGALVRGGQAGSGVGYSLPPSHALSRSRTVVCVAQRQSGSLVRNWLRVQIPSHT